MGASNDSPVVANLQKKRPKASKLNDGSHVTGKPLSPLPLYTMRMTAGE